MIIFNMGPGSSVLVGLLYNIVRHMVELLVAFHLSLALVDLLITAVLLGLHWQWPSGGTPSQQEEHHRLSGPEQILSSLKRTSPKKIEQSIE